MEKLLSEYRELEESLKKAIRTARRANYWETHSQLIYALHEVPTGLPKLPKEEFYKRYHTDWDEHLYLCKAFSGNSITCDPKVGEAINKCLKLAVEANLTAVVDLLNKAKEKYPENLQAALAPEGRDRLSEQLVSDQTSFNKNDKLYPLKFFKER